MGCNCGKRKSVRWGSGTRRVPRDQPGQGKPAAEGDGAGEKKPDRD